MSIDTQFKEINIMKFIMRQNSESQKDSVLTNTMPYRFLELNIKIHHKIILFVTGLRQAHALSFIKFRLVFDG